MRRGNGIGVHSPELREERELDNVRRYVREHAITYPVAVDNEFASWRRYGIDVCAPRRVTSP